MDRRLEAAVKTVVFSHELRWKNEIREVLEAPISDRIVKKRPVGAQCEHDGE